MYLIKGQSILAYIETIEAEDGEDKEIIEAERMENRSGNQGINIAEDETVWAIKQEGEKTGEIVD